MIIYVAGGVDRIDSVRAVMAALREAGHTISYDWTARYDARPERPGDAWWEETADSEAEGVAMADAVIALPGGRGTATEVGIALGRGRRVTMLRETLRGEGPPCPFDHLCDVTAGPESDWPRMAVEEMR